MSVPSLSSGCEIAQFFVRYMAPNSNTHQSHDDSMMMSRSKSQDDDSMMTSLPTHTTHTVILSVWISRDKERACRTVLKSVLLLSLLRACSE
jgi:hypothetical protein